MTAQLISNSLISRLKPRATHYDVRDSKLKGFIVRVNKSGAMSYLIQYGRGKRITLGSVEVLTAAQAREMAMEILANVAKGIDPMAARHKKKNQVRLHDFLQNEYSAWAKTHLKTKDKGIKAVCYHFAYLLDRPLANISVQEIEKWRTKMLGLESIKPNTINRVITSLCSVFSKAVEWGVISAHPFRGFKNLKYDDTRIRYLTEEEEQRLFQALLKREDHYRQRRQTGNEWLTTRGYSAMKELTQDGFVDHLMPLVIVGLNTGLRAGELLSLERQHVHLDKHYIHIPKTKNAISKNIPLNAMAENTLATWLKQIQMLESLYVFPNPTTPQKHLVTVKTAWNKLIKDAQIENFRIHDMRHHFASKLVMAGVDLNTVRELLGHSDLQMTLRYAHLVPEHKAEAVARIKFKVGFRVD